MSDKAKKTKGTPDAIDVHVGKRLHVRRSLLGLSQEKLANAVGLTFQQIQKYEKGMNRVSAGRLYKLASVLDVPVSYFFENVEAASIVPPVGLSDNAQDTFLGPSDLMHDKRTIELVRAFHLIQDEKVRRDVLRLVKSMAGSLQRDDTDDTD